MTKVSQDILRALVRDVVALQLHEDAVSPARAASRGLALMTPGQDEGAYVLYDQDKAVKTMLELPAEPVRVLTRALVQAAAVVGMMYVDRNARCWNSRTVSSVASEPGLGPLLYDAAMADGPLAPMRNSVSLSAERVWRHYYERRSDVVHEPLDMGCSKHVKVRPWLNFSYRATSPIDVSSLTQRHEAAVSELSYDFSRSEVESALREAGSRYFDARYVEA